MSGWYRSDLGMPQTTSCSSSRQRGELEGVEVGDQLAGDKPGAEEVEDELES